MKNSIRMKNPNLHILAIYKKKYSSSHLVNKRFLIFRF